jgi:hypothetical protein
MGENSAAAISEIILNPPKEGFFQADPLRPLLYNDRQKLSQELQANQKPGEKLSAIIPPYVETTDNDKTRDEAKQGAFLDVLATVCPDAFGQKQLPDGLIGLGKPNKDGLSIVITPFPEICEVQSITPSAEIPPDAVLQAVAEAQDKIPPYDEGLGPDRQHYFLLDSQGKQVNEVKDAAFRVQTTMGPEARQRIKAYLLSFYEIPSIAEIPSIKESTDVGYPFYCKSYLVPFGPSFPLLDITNPRSGYNETSGKYMFGSNVVPKEVSEVAQNKAWWTLEDMFETKAYWRDIDIPANK